MYGRKQPKDFIGKLFYAGHFKLNEVGAQVNVQVWKRVRMQKDESLCGFIPMDGVIPHATSCVTP